MILKRVLVIDDEKNILAALKGGLEDEGYLVETAKTGAEGLDQMRKFAPDVVLLDIWMPGEDGIKRLDRIKKWDPIVEVIMMSGHGTVETAVKAIKLGAFDFLEKPLQLEKLLLLVQHAFELKTLKSENTYLKKELEGETLTTESPSMKKLMNLVEAAAPSNGWVLIQGEMGTGKELVARALHQGSKRAKHRFVYVNCGSLSEDSCELELFGSEKAPSGERKIGYFEQADGGTLYLDELGDLTPGVQETMLEALENNLVRKTKGKSRSERDVRILASTSFDLKALVAQGQFLEDLFLRLNIIPMAVPPLRERMQCLPTLVSTFSRRYSKGRTKVLTQRTLKLLQSYPWPGNVRELKNWVERACIFTPGEEIDVLENEKTKEAPKDPIDLFNFEQRSLMGARRSFEKQFLQRLLSENEGDSSKIAVTLGVGKAYLSKKIKSFQLDDGVS